MKHDGTRAALDHFERLVEPDERGEVVGLPLDPEPVHCLIPQPSGLRFALARWSTEGRPVFLERWDRERAACGRFVKVVMPQVFDDADEDACERCVAEVVKWAAEPEAWWEREYRRENKRYERDLEREDMAEWRERENRRRWGEG